MNRPTRLHRFESDQLQIRSDLPAAGHSYVPTPSNSYFDVVVERVMCLSLGTMYSSSVRPNNEDLLSFHNEIYMDFPHAQTICMLEENMSRTD